MGRKGYPPEFKRRALHLVEAGRSIAEVARDLDISPQSIYRWQRQDRIDKGTEPGTTSVESAEMIAARRRIAQLESELAIANKAVELLSQTTDPKGGSRPSE